MAKERKNIICFVGSRNQTSQLHQVSKYLEDDYNIYYTQIFGSGFMYKFFAEAGVFDNTVFGRNSSFTQASQEYIRNHNLSYDYRGISKNIKYDMALVSTDLIIPNTFKNLKTIWVQEGMIDPLSNKSLWVKKMNLPAYSTGDTSLNGTTNQADIYCSMSHGYKDYFEKHGTSRDKIIVTGVPNFDNIQSLTKDDYHEKDFVLFASSDIRELGGNDDRIYLLKKIRDIANGKKIIAKPHPNENLNRFQREVKAVMPEAEIITEPILDILIAHCDTLITQFSSCAYVGLVLGKKVYSYFPIEDLELKKPIQNQGKSAEIISKIARDFIEFKGAKNEYIKQSELVKQYQ